MSSSENDDPLFASAPQPKSTEIFTKEEVRKATLAYYNDELSTDVWMGKCALRNEKEEYLEKTPADTQARAVRELYRIEKGYQNPTSEETIAHLMRKWKFVIPQGSPQSAMGNPYMVQSLSNCFVVPGAYDSYGGIAWVDQEQAQIMKRRGGVGHDISNIRPKNVRVTNAARTTAGIAPYLQRFSNTTREVGQDGRRGALMLTISCKHPEIMTFIDIKRDKSLVTGANMSIHWTDDFMAAVEKDEDFTLQWPVDCPPSDAKITKTIKAKEIWDAFVSAAHECAEPGSLFWDTIIRESISDCYAGYGFRTVCTNPCFAAGTMVATKNGHEPIEKLVGRTVSVWDGHSWVDTATFRVTGHNQPVLALKMLDGTTTRLTPNHVCILADNTRVPAEKLKPGMILKHGAPLVHGSTPALAPYVKGYLCAERGTPATRESMLQSTLMQRWVSEETHLIPLEVFKWALEDKLEFIAGFMDADGETRGEKWEECTYVVSGENKERLDQFQMLLRTVGVYGPARVRFDAHERPWEIRFSRAASVALAQMVKFSRLISLAKFGGSEKENETRGSNGPLDDQAYTVRAVYPDGVEDEVYCATVQTRHNFALTNGILFGNCGEIPLSAYDACRLMALNLMGCVKNPFTPQSYFDYQLFGSVVRTAQRLMDNLVDLEIEAIERIIAKVKSDPEPEAIKSVELLLWQRILAANTRGRRTGLGITALGDCLAALGLRYGSEASIAVTEKIYRTLAVHSELENTNLAKERGCFPVWSAALEVGNPYLARVQNAILEDLGPDAYRDYMQDYHAHGRRAISTTTTAPVGTTSMQTLVLEHPDGDIFSSTSGCEPVAVSLETIRRRKLLEGATDTNRVDFVDPSGDKWQEYKVYHPGLTAWMRVTGLSDIKQSPYHQATSRDIDWEASVDLQAAAQRWVSHSISKTCNLPEDASKELVSKCYMRAWKTGCKGFTVYREGSRTGVIVAASAAAKKDPRELGKIVENHAPRRPDVLPCDVHFARIKGDDWIALVGLLADKPYEVFVGQADKVLIPKRYKTGELRKRGRKQGGVSVYDLALGQGEDELVVKDVATTFDDPENGAFTRALSLSLRHGVPVAYIVEQLLRDKHSDFTKFSAVLARVLKRYIKDGTVSQAQKQCPSCGASPLTYVEGCASCRSCGWSKC